MPDQGFTHPIRRDGDNKIMTAKDHNKMLGIFLMIHGGMQTLFMGLLCLIYGGVGVGLLLGGHNREDKTVGMVFFIVVIVLAIISALLLLPQIIGGWKILKERPNARVWGIIGSIVACLFAPLGTAAGVYGLWFLFGDQGKRFYVGGPQYQSRPPEPGAWQ